MENSLLKSLLPLLSSCQNLHQCVTACADTDADQFPVQISGIKGSLNSFFLAQFIDRIALNEIHARQYENRYSQFQKDYVIVVSTQKDADECQSDLETVLGESVEIHKLPWWGTIPYRPVSVGAAVFGERAGVLARMAGRNPSGGKPRIFILSQRALITPVPPVEYIKSLSINLRKGQEADIEKIAEQISSYGYMRVPKVNQKGEFALRGEVLDVFISGEEKPVRIQFDFDTIQQIRTFDVESQNTKEKVERLIIYPMKEIVWTDDLVDKLEKVLEAEDSSGIKNDFAAYDKKRRSGITTEAAGGDEAEEVQSINSPALNSENIHLALTDKALEEKDRILTELSVKKETEGEELFYGLLWEKQHCVLDYLADDTSVFFYDWDRLVNAKKMLDNEYSVSYRTARQILPVFLPSVMQLDFYALVHSIEKLYAFRSLETLSNNGEEQILEDFSIQFNSSHSVLCEPSQSYFGNINYFKEQLSFYQNEKWHIFIFADNANQALRINELVKDFVDVKDNTLFPVTVLPCAVTSGFSISDEKILVIQENEIFGRKRNAPKSTRKVRSEALDSFVDLTPGDYVVHVNYGIGRFLKIDRLKSMGTEKDYIKVEYADEDIVYIPIEQVNMVQRYIGSESEHPHLDRIGSKSWSARKAKVQKQVEEMAERLIDLYSKRQASRGYPFPKDGEWSVAFEAAFPYEDTPDQWTTTQDIKADMESSVPMDRLVCGDVGYGKTEIAMRAAFKAVMGGKQVAFLAPTTILAEQHYENCMERFKNFPVTIAHMSRFVTPAEQKKILKKVADRQVDILIGTHRIIQKDVKFADLGLMIIDEEQRFGVKDKEKLKEMKTNIDCLALSATPIPRTLHMSLLKIRDMSLLTTPPQNRQPVETAIEEYNDDKIARAIRQEVDRGGQVFYLHNGVESLEETRLKIERLVPEMLVEVAHGQMSSDELDDIFRRFKMGGFHILVATTIIENGIDIPNVNTIIIDRADMYGVSQLYQLRGRVGRSDRKAYAYLFYPENKVLSEVALKRLQVISDFTELGSGFKIAMKDLEIRGAGNLLGRDQSGEVCAVGFEMYLQLLNTAIERLSNSNWHAAEEVLLELEYSGFIPDSYIDDAQTKMELYKKIASIDTYGKLDSLYTELEDRFGPVPEEVQSLLSLSKIRIICNKLSIASLKEKKGVAMVEFSKVAEISMDKLLKLIRTNSDRIRLDPAKPNFLILKTGSIDLKSKAEFIQEKLEMLV